MQLFTKELKNQYEHFSAAQFSPSLRSVYGWNITFNIILPPANVQGNYWLTALTRKPCKLHTLSVQNMLPLIHYDIILRVLCCQVLSPILKL